MQRWREEMRRLVEAKLEAHVELSQRNREFKRAREALERAERHFDEVSGSRELVVSDGRPRPRPMPRGAPMRSVAHRTKSDVLKLPADEVTASDLELREYVKAKSRVREGLVRATAHVEVLLRRCAVEEAREALERAERRFDEVSDPSDLRLFCFAIGVELADFLLEPIPAPRRHPSRHPEEVETQWRS